MAADVRLTAIDDDPNALELLRDVLDQPGLCISTATDPERGWQMIRTSRPNIVILDHNMPELSGMELLARITEWDPAVEVVMLTGEYDTDLAVEAIRRGASDYLTKPVTPTVLRERIGPKIKAAALRQTASSLEQEMLQTSRFCDMIGHSAAMQDVFAMIQRVAPHFRSVLISGPTGTGKELVARALHRSSTVRNKPLVVCNCAAIVETLFESELFGHVRGSFTGATNDRAGLFEAADGGVLFLDEIGEVPLRMQAKFLRALQNGEVQRVGSNTVRKVNVRVIAATNRDIRRMAREQQFREDLYYRLSMLEIRIPALEDRKEDLPLLTRHFVHYFATQMGKTVSGITRRAQTVLSLHHWPGNIRELENVIGHACTMTDNEFIDVTDLPKGLRTAEASDGHRARMTLAEVEKEHIQFVYENTAGRNKQLAAEILGISRATLYRFLKENDGEAA